MSESSRPTSFGQQDTPAPQIYADLPDTPIYQPASPAEVALPSPDPITGSTATRPVRRSPAIGTIVFGLATIILGVLGLLGQVAGYHPDHRATAAAVLASLGILLVLSSTIGLFRHRGSR